MKFVVVDEWVVILVDETHAHVVLSLVHHTEDLALKSPKVMVNKELQKVVSLRTFGSETYI